MRCATKPRRQTLLALFGALLAVIAIVPAAASAAGPSFATAGEHAFVVPVAVNSVQVTLVGGNGGSGSASTTRQARGGPGATVTATLVVTPGETLYAHVAGDGQQSGAGGYGGGGAGGPVVALFAGAPGGGGGGGASTVARCPAATPPRCSPLVVAGGGGGGGGAGLDTTPTINGGNGGAADMAGSDGEMDVSKHDAGGGGGKAGSQSAGGAAGANSYQEPAKAGRPAVGGDGGTSIGGGGGGGGGGLFGGGGGGAGNGFADFYKNQFFSGAGGGGGGGSSGVPVGADGVSSFSLRPTGDGAEPSITFTWTPPPPAASTAAAAAVTRTGATLTGTVNPYFSQVTDCHFTIVPAAAAGGGFPCAQQLGAGATPASVSAAAVGLAPATRYTATLIAANAQGATSGGAVTFTTAAAGPRVRGLKVSPSRFRRGRHRARVARSGAGTTLTFRLSAAARVKLTFERAAPGRTAGHRCVAATAARHRAARCTRYTRVTGAMSTAARVGLDRIHFEGVLDGGRRLALGTYRLSLVAVDAAGLPSPAQHTKFTIVS